MDKKYKLTEETKEIYGRTLRRIQALEDFGEIKAGDLGGWIESEENLSHNGNCWVWDSAWVYGNVRVSDNAQVSDNARVRGDARVYGNALVCGKAQVYGAARVYGNALVCGKAQVCEDAQVCKNAQVCENARVSGAAQVSGNAQVCENAQVSGNAQVCEDARVCGKALVYGVALVCGKAQVYGNVQLEKTSDYLSVFPIGSRNGATTFFKTAGGKIFVKCGCFEGDIERFAAKVRETHGDNRHARAYLAAIELAKIQIEREEI
jgi:carbonic anhydrase/acetyltransferase-like protein (isoleucine patch superfamily)